MALRVLVGPDMVPGKNINWKPAAVVSRLHVIEAGLVFTKAELPTSREFREEFVLHLLNVDAILELQKLESPPFRPPNAVTKLPWPSSAPI